MPKPEPSPLPAVPGPSAPAQQSPTKRPRTVLTADVDAAIRTALVADALAATRKAVDIIAKTFADGVGDFDDAVKALPLLHKVIEHAERIEAQANDTQSQVPLIIRFERAPIPQGFVVDVRTGADVADLRRKAQAARDACPDDPDPDTLDTI